VSPANAVIVRADIHEILFETAALRQCRANADLASLVIDVCEYHGYLCRLRDAVKTGFPVRPPAAGPFRRQREEQAAVKAAA